jgi:alpha-1,3-glucan synthase
MRPFTNAATAAAAVAVAGLALLAHASPYREDLVAYNLNTNKDSTDPTQFSTNVRSNKTYTPSPANWREVAFYTVLPDKFADGDPSNNDYFGTVYEYDWREPQLRAGGDLQGIINKLDYIQGMGMKGLFISGTPFLNMIWQADSQ